MTFLRVMNAIIRFSWIIAENVILGSYAEMPLPCWKNISRRNRCNLNIQKREKNIGFMKAFVRSAETIGFQMEQIISALLADSQYLNRVKKNRRTVIMVAIEAKTPEELAQEMKEIAKCIWTEERHLQGDAALCETLKALGYGEAVQIFCNMDKWYS